MDFAMRILMIITSLLSYFINNAISKSLYSSKGDFNFEQPLTSLIWLTSIISICITFIASYLLLGNLEGSLESLWWSLSIIISCGTIAGALIPEFTKFSQAPNQNIAKKLLMLQGREAPPLNILSGFVAGNFSAFWEGLAILVLMLVAYIVSKNHSIIAIMPESFVFAAPVFAFGLVAFGFLGMGPVTIAVDSFGPVSDNAQSIYELSMIEVYQASKKH